MGEGEESFEPYMVLTVTQKMLLLLGYHLKPLKLLKMLTKWV